MNDTINKAIELLRSHDPIEPEELERCIADLERMRCTQKVLESVKSGC